MKHARDDYNRIQDPAGKIPADEPVFLLRAQDELACKAVAYYASLCERAQAPEVAAKARVHADLMAAWPKKKVPDLAPPSPDDAAQRIATLRRAAHTAADAAEKAWYELAGELDVGPDRTRAFEVYENLRHARRVG